MQNDLRRLHLARQRRAPQRRQADATLGSVGDELLRESYAKYRRSGAAFAELSQSLKSLDS